MSERTSNPLIEGAPLDSEEKEFDVSLRPKRLREYIGQKKVADNLDIFVRAALKRSEALDHALLYGPPGLGKCITADSLVLTGDGLVPFEQLIPKGMEPDTSRPCELRVQGLAGVELATEIYYSGFVPTVRIETSHGFVLEGTPHHPVLIATVDGPQWAPLGALSADDRIAIALETDLWPADDAEATSAIRPTELDRRGLDVEDAGRHVGVAHEGWGATAAVAARIPASDCDTMAQVDVRSFSGGRARVVAAFRRLEREGRVVVDSLRTTVLFDSEDIARFAHVQLVNLGVVSRCRRSSDDRSAWTVSVEGPWQEAFRALVHGERSRSTVTAALTDVGVAGRLRIFWDRVERLADSTAHVYDFVVPGTHSFVANGIVSHNTTLANIIANEMGVDIKSTSGPVIEKSGDLAAILTNLKEHDVLFIDEIHRLNPAVEEVLYPAMEDFQLDIIIGQGPAARSIKLDLPPFTLVGATTRAGLITAPLRGRFGIRMHLDFYPPNELEIIVLRSAGILGVEIDAEGASEIARRSRGTPRIANRLLRRVRDIAEVLFDGRVTVEVARQALDRLEIDTFGLDESDVKLLRTIMDKFDGGPVGLGTISAAINEEKDAIEEVIEPYLIQIGFLNRTPRGRIVTRAAYDHFGLNPLTEQGGLFS